MILNYICSIYPYKVTIINRYYFLRYYTIIRWYYFTIYNK